MKAAARKWVVVTACVATATVWCTAAMAAEVTDVDRSYRNFTRETATVGDGKIRVEVRGLSLHDENDTVLNIAGFRLRSLYGETYVGGANTNKVTGLTGVQADLVGSYGLGANAELGVIVPGFVQTVRFAGGGHQESQDMGDLQLYGKFKQAVAENCNVGGGVELSMPNGPVAKGFGTGELGVTPFVSTRYHHGPFGVGVNAGYTFYSGQPQAVDNTFLYGAEVFVRPAAVWTIRTEIAGRLFTQGGTQFNDLSIMPGFDFRLTDNVTLRPTGLANGTNSAIDWGLGLGIAGTL